MANRAIFFGHLDLPSGTARLACVCISLGLFGSCGHHGEGPVPTPSTAPPSRVDAADIVAKHMALDASRTSVMRLRAVITESEDRRREVRLDMYRKQEADGRLVLLVHFVSPREERDRSGLITTFPDGAIKAVRYAQSADRFVTTVGATGEDSLFGMTLQELVGAQQEKYDFQFVEDSALDSTPVYKLEGNLKAGADSKFPRMVMAISKEDYAALMIELYDHRDQLERRMTVEKGGQIDGFWTRMRWTLDNPARGKRIEFDLLDVKYNEDLADSIFTKENLKKVSLK